MPLTNYDFDFTKMIRMILGPIWRQSKRVAWLTAGLAGLRKIHDDFIAFTDAKMEEVKYNSQTFVLEKALIAKFGDGIYITNNIGSIDGLFVGDGSDISNYIGDGPDTDTYIDIVYDVALFNFTVNVPSSIVFVTSEMEAFVRKYKLIGTTFNIVIV
jgi:hypothetical protein